MKLGVVNSGILSPSFGGGGAVHTLEVLTRLKDRFQIVLFPSSPSLKWDKEKLMERAKWIESKGIRVDDAFYSLIEEKEVKKASPEELANHYDVDGVDFVYEPDHTSTDIYYIGGKRGKYGMTIHEPMYYADSLQYLKRLIKFYGINPKTGKGFHTRFLYNELVAKRVNRKLMKRFPPSFIASVSKGSLEWSGLSGEVLYPGNAFDPSLLDYRGKGKEDYVVFWSRLNQDKGIKEIPAVMRIINSMRRTRLVLMGKFFDKYNESLFWRKVRAYGLDVEYLGFVERKKLNEVVSRAKCLIYPSHVDGFSLVVLESLALGTPVVAYDIPTIRSVYSGLSAVKLVPEFDVRAMGEEAARLIERDPQELMEDQGLLEFLRVHSSWDNVANSIEALIRKYV
ncbi:glycosyltransferase family 4 protein [Metallosphaera tengchongensis]|uniref:Glycosyltransferase family 4 protein n=1 Tax=Metallosphaera tengchongensis TaxID=1532350 RepID=A0A6N0P0T5_9CREN|nr:glycosyltransferase family 4 protein [Metallosphaera tengchongensis]QKR00880.1 glycosyltransferase family 4 protein [Metallosphaera tengchongensis]